MMRLLLSEDIRKVEQNASNYLTYLSMMENASRAVVSELCRRQQVNGKNIIVITGSGNNGGDGYGVARMLSDEGAFVKVMAVGSPKSETAQKMRSYFGGEITDYQPSLILNADIVVDALFGIGLTHEADSFYTDIIKAVNESSAYTVSIDIPSGLFADSNKEYTCVKADLTVTFIAYKKCQLLYPAREFCGEICLSNIGIPSCAYEGVDEIGKIISAPVFEKRKSNTHKGSYKTASLVVGSYGMTGAAVLSIRGCLKSGIGLAKACIQDEIYPIVTSNVPEAVCEIYSSQSDSSSIAEMALSADATLVGCGFAKSEKKKEIVKEIIKSAENILIIDADGLNLICDDIECIKRSKADIVITPHPAEMARLCKVSVKEIENDRIYYAKAIAASLRCTVVLKGSVTIICSKEGRLFFNLTGNAGMATGGSGDVLAGVIVSLAAQYGDSLKAATDGVYIHGLAGDMAKNIKGEISMLPSDLIECLPDVFKKLTR